MTAAAKPHGSGRETTERTSESRERSASFTAIRHEAAVAAGQSTRYSQDGHEFEFGCAADAQAMNFKALKAVASGKID